MVLYKGAKKWKVFEEFKKGKRPSQVKDGFDLKDGTIYRYFQEFKERSPEEVPEKFDGQENRRKIISRLREIIEGSDYKLLPSTHVRMVERVKETAEGINSLREESRNSGIPKWRIMDEFREDKRPMDLYDKYPVKKETLYAYWQDFKGNEKNLWEEARRGIDEFVNDPEGWEEVRWKLMQSRPTADPGRYKPVDL